MPPPDHNSKITIEDLLRLKRAERPGADFWANFEQELRQKQLTALVKKRRLWHDIPILLNHRFYVPAGAAAIMAFTMLTVRFPGPTQNAESAGHASRSTAVNSPVEMLDTVVIAESDLPEAANFEEAITVSSELRGTAGRIEARVSGDSRPVAARVPVSRAIEAVPSRLLAANVVGLDGMEPDLVNAALSSRLSPQTYAQTAALNQSDLVESSNSSAKQYRLIARYADTAVSPEPMAPALVRERLARRLGDDLGDSISRIGVVGSKVSLKF